MTGINKRTRDNREEVRIRPGESRGGQTLLTEDQSVQARNFLTGQRASIGGVGLGNPEKKDER